MARKSLVWLRQDLRLDDQPAIAAAANSGPFVVLYVLDDGSPGQNAIGAAQRWWLHHSLTAFKRSVETKGGRLVLRRGRSAKIVAEIADELDATTVHAVRHLEPWWRAAEDELDSRLTLYAPDTLVPPEFVRTGGGQPYRIYTPFYRAFSQIEVAAPISSPKRFETPANLPKSDRLEDWNLLPMNPNWASKFDVWTPGEEGSRQRLGSFRSKVAKYAEACDLPSCDGTSMLSPHLHFGEISPRRIHQTLEHADGAKFLKELAWRDFSRNAMSADPLIGERSQRKAQPNWRTGKQADSDFVAWSRGLTGYPIVDAGMRQLWAIGWMHNRVRMIAASFLVKHLLIDWRKGERWFWDTLVDADYGNNSLNWQWIAGTGFDSQPFGRIMAPLLQSAKFDAASYIRKWVPELANLPDNQIHDPPRRPDYPAPLIGHQEGRERALAATKRTRSL